MDSISQRDLSPAFPALVLIGPAVDVDSLQQAEVLSDIEARLTGEMRGLVGALTEFSGRAKLIGEEIPANAQFCKVVTGFLVLFGLQVANALGKGMDEPVFADDGALYLKKLGLQLNDLLREVNLDGRRFLAIALPDQGTGHVFDGDKQ